jgi:ParB-like chromosome segregation protein Spo0J
LAHAYQQGASKLPIEVNAPGHSRANNVFVVNPEDVIVRGDLRGREYAPDEAAIISLAINISENGQIQPARGRKLPHEDNRIELSAGFSRYAAIMLLREGFEHEGIKYHKPGQRFSVQVTSGMSDLDAIKLNISENRERNQTTAIDDAHNIRRLEQLGQTLDEVAAFYRWPLTKVEKTLSLLALSADERQRVHLGEIPVSAALELLKIAPAARAEVVAEAEAAKPAGSGKKLKGTAINKVIREKHLTNTPAPGTAPSKAKSIARPYSEVKSLFEPLTMYDGPCGPFAKAFLEYCAGQISNDKMLEALERFVS